MALVVCLAGCATAPHKHVAVDESAHFARPLKPEAEKRAEAMARFGAGLLLLANDNREDALKEFEKAIEIDPANDELAVYVASEFYIRQHEYSKAIPMLERAVSFSPKSMPALFMLAHAYRLDNKQEQALATYERITQASPTEIMAYRGMVEILISLNRKSEAMKLLSGAAKQKSEDAKFWAGLGDLFAGTAYEEPAQEAEPKPSSEPPKVSVKARKPPVATRKINPFAGFARALDCYERAAKLEPENEVLLKKLADLYVVNKLFEKAVPLYLKLLEERPNRTDIRERLALSYVAQDDKKKAIAQIEEIVKKEPLKFKYQMMLGELYLDASRGEKDEKPKEGEISEKHRLLDRALAKFQEAVILNPNEIDPQLNIAYICLLQKKPQQAIETLDKAREKFPTNARLFYFYGLSHSDLKQYDQAVRSFADTLKLADDTTEGLLDSTFFFYYGAALERAGDIEGAAEKFLKSIEINANNAEAYNYLGYMWAEKGVRLNEALNYIKKALEHEPENGAYLDSLGWVYFKLGKYEDALKELLRAATLIKEPDPTVFDHIAECYMQLGKKDEAITQWKRAIEADPTNKEIVEKLKQAQGGK
jgi:tetratricopeptide (TPR) repeat protein